MWTLPTDRFVTDVNKVVVTATSAGSGEVVLRGLAPDGTELQFTHTFRVVEK